MNKKKRQPEVFLFPKIPSQSSFNSLPYFSSSTITASTPINNQGYLLNSPQGNVYTSHSSSVSNFNEFVPNMEGPMYSPIGSKLNYENFQTPEKFNDWNRGSSLSSLPSPASKFQTNIYSGRLASYGSIPFMQKQYNDNLFNDKLDRLMNKQNEILKRILGGNSSIDLKIQPYVDEYVQEKYKMKASENTSPQIRDAGNFIPHSMSYNQLYSNYNETAQQSNYYEGSHQKSHMHETSFLPNIKARNHHKSNSTHVSPQQISEASRNPPFSQQQQKVSGFGLDKLKISTEKSTNAKGGLNTTSIRQSLVQRRKYFRFKLKIWMFTLFFPVLLFNAIKKKARERKATSLNRFLERKTKAELDSIGFFQSKLEALLKQCLESSNSLVVASVKRKGFKALSDQEIQSRMEKSVKPRIREFIQELIKTFNGEDIKESIWEFIGLLIIENSFLPDKFLFEVEIKRLQFNTLGALKDVKANQQNMLIGNFLLVRILIYKLILGFDVHTSIKRTEATEKNALSLASMIYNIFDDYFKKKSKELSYNTVHLDKDTRLTKAEPIFLAPEYERLWKMNQDKWSEDSILGLFTKEELSKAMESSLGWVGEIQDQIEYWLNNIRHIVLDKILKKEGKLVRRSSL